MAPTEIIPGLWLGNQDDSQLYFFMKEKKIQILLNCTIDVDFPTVFNILDNKGMIEKKRFSIRDIYEDNNKMYENLESLVDFINQALNKNQNILVYSTKGQQRAPTVIAGYFIKYGRVNGNQAIKYIQSKRPNTFKPQCTFEYTLHEYSKKNQYR
jgi:hypothetical protein